MKILKFLAEMNNSSSILKCFQEFGNVVIKETLFREHFSNQYYHHRPEKKRFILSINLKY